MTIRTRAELDEALRRVLAEAIADEEPTAGPERGSPLVTVAPSDQPDPSPVTTEEVVR